MRFKQYLADFDLGFRLACVAFMLACLVGLGCVEQLPDLSTVKVACEDDGTDWYFVDCPQNPQCPTAPVAVCMDGDGKVLASGCEYLGHGFVITCVERCEP